jgi:hypothetical protein
VFARPATALVSTTLAGTAVAERTPRARKAVRDLRESIFEKLKSD